MKLSLNWIKKYVDLPKDLTVTQLAHDLTMKTVEVEEVINLSENYNDILIGKILSVEDHSNADSLKVCKVDVGRDKIYQIVCGGTNLYVDEIVIVALPGSKVRWHGEGELVTLEETKLRGEISQGMICAANELGLGDVFVEDEALITDLTEYNFEVGMNVADALGLNDYIIDIDNKSLTNRPDLWSHYGIAREIAAIYNLELKSVEDKAFVDFLNFDVKAKYNLEIKDKDLCKRFVSIVVDNVSDKESPLELKMLLHNIGEKPINLLVDISNYLMFSLGQPMHFYDYDKIKEGIIIRRAFEGEKFITLDDEELELNTNNLVIADHEKVLGLAGVIGGKNDSITKDTKKIVIEMANFDALNVRETSQEYDIRTNASMRFEKNIDPTRIDTCFNLLFTTLRKYFPSLEIIEYNDQKSISDGEMYKKEIIDISQSFLDTRLGKRIRKDTILSNLEKLGFKVEVIELDNDRIYKVEVPYWRATGDIAIKDDILEEVGRMYGYERFETITPKVLLNNAIIQKDKLTNRKIQEYLSFSCGLSEIQLYPFVHEKYIDAIGINKEKLLTLADPPSPETKYIRTSLIPGILSAVETNLKNFDNFGIYEVGRIFLKNKMEEEYKEHLPIQTQRLAGAVVGKDANEIFFKVKGIISNMARNVQISELELVKLEEVDFLEKNAYLNIVNNNQVIGYLGLLSKKTMVKAGIKNANVCVFDINLNELKINKARENKFIQLPQHPLVKIDLNVLIDNKVSWAEIEEIVLKTADHIEFVEEYKGEQVPEGKKSIMFHLVYDGKDRTLKDKDIKARTSKIIEDLKTLGAQIRE